MTQQALYRFYNDGGQLLYVGITNDPPRRMTEHSQDKAWWPQVRGMTVDWYPDRDAVLAAERRAIRIEHPLHNSQHRHAKPKAKAGPATNRLTWRCHRCEEPVEDGRGYIHVSSYELARHQRAIADYRERNKGWRPIDVADLMSLPGEAEWRVTHTSCDPDPDSNDYWFDVARCRTWPMLLGWSAHLMQKSWITSTDFSEFLYGALDAHGEARDC